jgi:hypothetical protein
MNYRDANHRKAREHHVVLLARIIEVRGGDDDGYADHFLRAVVSRARPNDRAIAPQRVFGGMLLVTRPDQGSTWPAKFVSRAAFIGGVGLQDEEAGHRLAEAFSKDWDRVCSLRLDGPPDHSCWFAGDGWWLSTAAA